MVLEKTEFNFRGFLNQIAIMGVFAAALVLIKGFVEETSPISLIISLLQNGVTLVITLVFFGLGNLENLGVTTMSVEMGEVVNTIKLDMRFFLQIAIIGILLKMLHAFVAWNEARKEREITELIASPEV